MGQSRVRPAVVVGLLIALGAACAEPSRSAGDAPNLRGKAIEVLAVWTGVERQAFEAVLDEFERRTQATVTYTPAARGGVAAALDARLAGNSPPDVAFLPQPGLLQRYVREGKIMAVDDEIVGAVQRNFGAVWRRLGSVNGRLYGVWFKAANKSLVWYDIAAFERLGLVPPDDLGGLVDVARALAHSGIAPFAVAAREGWTLTDWFENLYVRVAGPEQYDRLAGHELAWTDESVKATLRLLAMILDPQWIAGGVEGALMTGFEASVQQVFGTPRLAAMAFEGDFVAGVIRGQTEARIGVDADVFAFPAVGRSALAELGLSGVDRTDGDSAVVGGGDAAVLLRPSPAGSAFLRFLATPEAAAIWAARSGFLSPNQNLDLSVYPDDLTRTLARQLLDAGDAFRFDLSDLTPAAFGGTEGQGMRAALQSFLDSRDVESTVALLESTAESAYGR